MKYNLTRLSIETCNICNLKCIMCLHHGPWYKKQADHHPRVMLLDDFEEIVDQYYSLNTEPKHLTPHFQGEPLCYPYFKEAMEYVDRKGISTNFNTNGMLMDKDMTDFLLTIRNLVDVSFSIDGVKKETLEKIRVGVHYETLIQNINYFCWAFRNKPWVRVSVNFVKMKENTDEFIDFVKEWIDRVSLIQSSICTDEDGIPQYHHWDPPERLPCLAPNYFSVILTNGDMIPCCRDHLYEMGIGNIYLKPLKELWEGEEYESLRRYHACRFWKSHETAYEWPLCMNCDTWMCEYTETMFHQYFDGSIFGKQGPFWEQYWRVK